jgi:hypothetical protein
MTDTASTNNNEPFIRPPDSTFEVVGNPRVKLPEKYKIEFQRLCLLILDHL